MNLHSQNPHFQNELPDRQRELIEIDAYGAMIAYLVDRLSFEKFQNVLAQLGNENILSEKELIQFVGSKIRYEARIQSFGKYNHDVFERAYFFKKTYFLS